MRSEFITPVVCSICKDTHRMTLHQDGDTTQIVMCTRCPTPCIICRAHYNDPYCATTPCGCECHPFNANRKSNDTGLSALEALKWLIEKVEEKVDQSNFNQEDWDAFDNIKHNLVMPMLFKQDYLKVGDKVRHKQTAQIAEVVQPPMVAIKIISDDKAHCQWLVDNVEKIFY